MVSYIVFLLKQFVEPIVLFTVSAAAAPSTASAADGVPGV